MSVRRMEPSDRVYSVNGVLKSARLNDYSVRATDVRHLVFHKGAYNLGFVWQSGKKVTTLTKQYKANWGFNFPFFWAGNPVSDVKVGRKILSNPVGGKTVGWSGFRWKDGVPFIGKVDATEDVGETGFLFQNSPLLIDSGVLVWKNSVRVDQTAPDIANSRCQRTLLGIDNFGSLHVAITDGRTGSDIGLTIEESALYMKSKGCVFALNGDGGSSTILSNSKGLGVNQSENRDAYERPVNHAVMVFLK